MNITYIKEALNGDYTNLSMAFIWMQTPQGHQYWRGIADGQTDIDDDGRKYLQSLVETLEQQEVTIMGASEGLQYSFRKFYLDDLGKLTSRHSEDMGKVTGYSGGSSVPDRNTPRYEFRLSHPWRDSIYFYGSFRQGDISPLCLVETDSEGNHKIFGQIDPVEKAFGLRSLEDAVKFQLRREHGQFFSGATRNWAASETIEGLVYSIRNVDHDQAVKSAHMFWPEFKQDGVEIYMNIRDLERGRRTTIKTGRFFRMILPKATDADIESLVDAYNERYRKREFVLKRSKDQDDFAHAYTGKIAKMLNPRTTSARKSLPNSCMHETEIQGKSPAEVYASGDFEVIWLETPQKGLLGGRVVVYVPKEGKPQAGPVYGTCEHSLDLLEDALREMGAVMYDDGADWDGARLKAIHVYGDDLLMPYCDMAEEAEHIGDYIVIGRGNLELHLTQGYVSSRGRNCCDSCGDSLYEEDEYISRHGDVFCECCYNDRYTHCSLTAEEIEVDEAVEVYTIQSRHVWRASVENPGVITVADWCDDYTSCVHTDELWLTEDMETDVDGEFVSPRYAQSNLFYINDTYYSAEQLAAHGLDTEGNEINKDEEEAA